MLINFAEGLFIIVNALIGIYIVIYAFIFLNRTKDYPDRRPWELLFIGSIFFMIGQIIAIATLFKVEILFGLEIAQWRIFLEFIYATLILLAFVTQSQLILLSDMILITKKVKRKKGMIAESKKQELEIENPERKK